MKNHLLKSFSILLFIGCPITFIGCGNYYNLNVNNNEVIYQESPVIDPIINIHAIANKTVDEVKDILGQPSSSEMTKYGIKNMYLDDKIEILFVKDIAWRITVESNDGNPELLSISKESIKKLPTENKLEIESNISYRNLEGLDVVEYNKYNDYFQILTKKEYLDIFEPYNSKDLINNKVNHNINDEKDFASQYYLRLNNIILKHNENYSDTYYNEIDYLLNEIYNVLKENTNKVVFAKIEKQEIEWINYKESKNSLKDKTQDTEMRIRDLLHIMENLQVYDVMSEYIPYFKY